MIHLDTNLKCTEFTTHSHSHSQIHLKLLLNESGVVPSSIRSWFHSCKLLNSLSVITTLCSSVYPIWKHIYIILKNGNEFSSN